MRGFGNGGGARCQRGKEREGGGFGDGAGAPPGGRGFKGGAEERNRGEGKANRGACAFVCARAHVCVRACDRGTLREGDLLLSSSSPMASLRVVPSSDACRASEKRGREREREEEGGRARRREREREWERRERVREERGLVEGGVGQRCGR